MHLFDVTTPGGQRFAESDAVAPGEAPQVAETPWGPLGLSICYDLRFPELFRRYSALGATWATVPAAFTAETGRDHWHVLLRARAIENQMFVVAPAQGGHHGGKRRSFGHALIVDPWGNVLADGGVPNRENLDNGRLAMATLDFGFLDEVRRRLPCLSHRQL